MRPRHLPYTLFRTFMLADVNTSLTTTLQQEPFRDDPRGPATAPCLPRYLPYNSSLLWFIILGCRKQPLLLPSSLSFPHPVLHSLFLFPLFICHFSFQYHYLSLSFSILRSHIFLYLFLLLPYILPHQSSITPGEHKSSIHSQI